MNRQFLILMLSAVLVLSTTQPALAIPAFPGAEGFGTNTLGGRGGQIIEVTNLNDSGPGSLRQAMEVETGPRIVVFRTGGTINLNRAILVRGADKSYLTIAGQTAPGGGIQLKNFGILIWDGAHDVVIRYLRVRPGTGGVNGTNGSNIDAIELYGPSATKRVYNVVLDHVSMEWAIDENASAWGHITDVTYQYSIFAEGSMEGHPKGPHSAGFIIGADDSLPLQSRVSMHHSLFADNMMRNPRNEMARMDFRNNLIYNWIECATANLTDGANINFVNNHYLKGPFNRSCNDIIGLDSSTKIYLYGNYGPNCPSGCTNDWKIGIYGGTEAANRVTTPFFTPTVTTDSSSLVKDKVLAKAGAILPTRDAVDARIVQNVINKTGSVGIGSSYPTLSAGLPPKDTDRDGMPDGWELVHGLNPNNASDRNGDFNGNGYTNVEDYLNELAK
jgi:pectate lyase